MSVFFFGLGLYKRSGALGGCSEGVVLSPPPTSPQRVWSRYLLSVEYNLEF